jgi:probable F420-dependent oxidoreductase
MKFGTMIMGTSFRVMPEVAAIYEENGFESLWVPEHLVFPAVMPPLYPYTDSGYPVVDPDTPTYDPWVVLAYIAAATSTIRLATNVYILPLRHPLQTARSVVTVDRVSGGRVTLGIGVGWLPDEFDYLRTSFHDRGKRTDAAIDAIRRLWTEDEIEVHDDHFDFGPVKFQPKPLQQPSIPIEVGGAAKAALRRAGALGDGWIEIGSSNLDEFEAKLAVVMDARKEAGRTGPFEVTAGAGLAGAAGLDGYRRLEEAGVTRIMTGPPRTEKPPWRVTPETASEWAKQFADNVIAQF